MMAIIWRNRIAEISNSKGLTISDLQKMVRMSYPSVHRLATSNTITDDTKAGTLRRIAAALGVSVTDLFREEEE